MTNDLRIDSAITYNYASFLRQKKQTLFGVVDQYA